LNTFFTSKKLVPDLNKYNANIIIPPPAKTPGEITICLKSDKLTFIILTLRIVRQMLQILFRNLQCVIFKTIKINSSVWQEELGRKDFFY